MRCTRLPFAPPEHSHDLPRRVGAGAAATKSVDPKVDLISWSTFLALHSLLTPFVTVGCPRPASLRGPSNPCLAAFSRTSSTARTRRDLPSRATAPRCTLAPLLIGAARGRRYESPHDPSDFTADLTLRFASMPPTPSSAQDWSIPSPGCAFRRRGLRFVPLHAEPLGSPPPRLRVTMRPLSSDRAGLTFEANTPLGFRRAWPSVRATLSGQHEPRSWAARFHPSESASTLSMTPIRIDRALQSTILISKMST